MDQIELKAKIDGLTTQVGKINSEVQNLLTVIQNQGNVSPEIQAAMDSLSTAIQGVDDLNPDTPTTPGL